MLPEPNPPIVGIKGFINGPEERWVSSLCISVIHEFKQFSCASKFIVFPAIISRFLIIKFIASAKLLEREGSISPSRFYG